MSRSFLLFFSLLGLLAPAFAGAQDGGTQGGGTPVRFTAARDHQIRQAVRLTGSVEARRTAVVATEVSGIVAELLAPEGSRVRGDSPLVRLRREPIELRLAAAQGELAEAQARLQSAELRRERVAQLHVSEVVSPQQVDDAAYDAEAWSGRVAQLRAEVARLERDLANTTVRASFTGVIGREHVQVGEWLDVGDPVAELISLDALEVRLEVPERYFDGLRPGTTATTTFEALPGHQLTGTVRAVVPRADPQARTFPVLVRLPASDRPLGVGMLAQVDLPVGGLTRATLVPKDAVVTRGRESFLFVLTAESAARRVVVETGTGAGQWIAVRGAVAPGQNVVTRGNEALADGQTVTGAAQDYPPPQADGVP